MSIRWKCPETGRRADEVPMKCQTATRSQFWGARSQFFSGRSQCYDAEATLKPPSPLSSHRVHFWAALVSSRRDTHAMRSNSLTIRPKPLSLHQKRLSSHYFSCPSHRLRFLAARVSSPMPLTALHRSIHFPQCKITFPTHSSFVGHFLSEKTLSSPRPSNLTRFSRKPLP